MKLTFNSGERFLTVENTCLSGFPKGECGDIVFSGYVFFGITLTNICKMSESAKYRFVLMKIF